MHLPPTGVEMTETAQYLPRHSGREEAVDILDGVAPGER
jgi:hypothetical protein